MSPEPWVRVQAATFVVLLFVSALLGQELATTITAGLFCVLALLLRSVHLKGLRAHGIKELMPERRRLDSVVSGDAIAAVSTGIAVGSLGLILDPRHLDVGVASPVVVPLLVIAAIVYLSSLIDWYVTIPRISGLLGPRPCRDRWARFEVFPTTWKETTRVWLLHRALAALAVRYGLGYAIALAVSNVAGLGLGPGRLVLTAAVLGGFASYVQAIPFASLIRPKLNIGQTVRAPDYKPRRFTLPVVGLTVSIPFVYSKTEDERTRKYVYDVAVEGYQLVNVEPFERLGTPQANYQSDPGDPLPLPKAGTSKPVNDSSINFQGCQGDRCSKINWYCIQNPNCFQTKSGA